MNEIELTDEMAAAMRLIRDTKEHVFITGKAGTGKTTLLRSLRGYINKNIIIAAPTGIAAVNAGGMTLHSLFCIPVGVLGPDSEPKFKVRKARKDLWKHVDTVIIDEVSMVRADMIDYIDRLLRAYRDHSAPFGGVQLVMFGDLYQLPPVTTRTEETAYNALYDGPYFFYAHAFKEKGFRVIELSKVFRQQEPEFVDVLNRIRNYTADSNDYDFLGCTYDTAISKTMDQNYIHICALRRDAQSINEKMLGEATWSNEAELEGDFPPASFPGEISLKLREGARVMILVNDSERRYCNGSLGNIVELDEDHIGVELDEGETVKLKKNKWSNNEYVVSNGKVEAIEKGWCEQFPVTLAWATTIHKSQGLTFDKVIIHAKFTFCPGQMYVALSRCRTLDGIITDGFIKSRHIIPDPLLSKFEEDYHKCNYYRSDRL